MLKIEISSDERWDEVNECFLEPVKQTIQLEHSLLSISKWEAKLHKSYYGTTEKTCDENRYYFECMVVTPNFDPTVLEYLSDDNLNTIAEYINDPMTATVVNLPKGNGNGGGSEDVVTSELLYYHMATFNLPIQCEKWHLNRLITLIKVCNAKQDTGTPISKEEAARKYAETNAARRKQYGSKG